MVPAPGYAGGGAVLAMKIKLTTCRVGNGFANEAGDVIDLPASEATALIQAGQAEPLGERGETAALETGAREVRKPRRAQRRKAM